MGALVILAIGLLVGWMISSSNAVSGERSELKESHFQKLINIIEEAGFTFIEVKFVIRRRTFVLDVKTVERDFDGEFLRDSCPEDRFKNGLEAAMSDSGARAVLYIKKSDLGIEAFVKAEDTIYSAYSPDELVELVAKHLKKEVARESKGKVNSSQWKGCVDSKDDKDI